MRIVGLDRGDAAIAWGVVIGFGAILTGAYLTTRKPKH